MQQCDPYNLQRFVDAQNSVFEQVCSELRAGKKQSHWMWFIFPQIEGLGTSQASRYFAISSKEEAEAYVNHPILGPRLRECSRLVNLVDGRSIDQIFGRPDDLKFRSSMTLFANATSENQVFINALQKYFGGDLDQKTLARLVLAALAVMPAPAMAGLISENVAEQSAKAGRRLRVVCRIGIVLSHPCDQRAANEGLQV